MVFCQKCGGELESGNRYCGACGTAIPEGETVETGSVSDATLIICSSCGAFVRGDVPYCTNCGQPLHTTPIFKVPKRSSPRELPCEFSIYVGELSVLEMSELAAILRGYSSNDSIADANGWICGAFSFSYRISEAFWNDTLFYAMLRSFCQKLGKRFPKISAAFVVRYPPHPDNLAKGYDDYGGWYSIRLKNGNVRDEEDPIV